MIKVCDCGGLYATEHLETFAGTPCRCRIPHTTAYDPTKRQFLRLAGTGAAGLALGGVIAPISQPDAPTPACSAKSVGAEISVVETFLKVVATELPNQSAIITKILKISDDFNTDYQRGDFANAASVFASLETDITQLINDIGVNISPRVKIALVLIDGAITAIAGLLKSQKTPAMAGMIANGTAEQKVQAKQIEDRAAKVDKLFAAIH